MARFPLKADQLPRMSGGVIYAIRSRVTGREYIGATANLRTRISCHRYKLRIGQHHSKLLQVEFNSVGFDGFEVLVLQRVRRPSGQRRRLRSHFWLERQEHAWATKRKPAFNVLQPNIFGGGFRFPEEITKAAQRKAARTRRRKKLAALDLEVRPKGKR